MHLQGKQVRYFYYHWPILKGNNLLIYVIRLVRCFEINGIPVYIKPSPRESGPQQVHEIESILNERCVNIMALTQREFNVDSTLYSLWGRMSR